MKLELEPRYHRLIKKAMYSGIPVSSVSREVSAGTMSPRGYGTPVPMPNSNDYVPIPDAHERADAINVHCHSARV
jgi:hypothetical protein